MTVVFRYIPKEFFFNTFFFSNINLCQLCPIATDNKIVSLNNQIIYKEIKAIFIPGQSSAYSMIFLKIFLKLIPDSVMLDNSPFVISDYETYAINLLQKKIFKLLKQLSATNIFCCTLICCDFLLQFTSYRRTTRPWPGGGGKDKQLQAGVRMGHDAVVK